MKEFVVVSALDQKNWHETEMEATEYAKKILDKASGLKSKLFVVRVLKVIETGPPPTLVRELDELDTKIK